MLRMKASVSAVAPSLKTPAVASALAAGGAMAGSWLLFVHLMQSSPAVNEFVGNLAPDIAAKFGCDCPFCTRTPACMAPASELSLQRLDTGLDDLLRGLPIAPR